MKNILFICVVIGFIATILGTLLIPITNSCYLLSTGVGLLAVGIIGIFVINPKFGEGEPF
jgi:hypothetical protein